MYIICNYYSRNMMDLLVRYNLIIVFLNLFLIAFSVPLALGMVPRNFVYGFRFRKSFESDLNWRLINQYGAKVLIFWLFIIIGLSLVLNHLLKYPMSEKYTFLPELLILIPICQTLLFSRRLK